MQTTRIDLQGDAPDNRFCTITRPRGSRHIVVRILTPGFPDGREHHVDAGDRTDVLSMAECLQETLDGQAGTNSMVYDYFCELQRFMD